MTDDMGRQALDLIEMSRSEAEQNLDDDEFQHWKELRDAKEHAEDYYSEREEVRETGLNLLTNRVKDELTETINVYGFELDIEVILDDKQFELIKELTKYKGMDEDDIEDTSEMKDTSAEFLASITEYSKDEWLKNINEMGLRGLFKVMGKVMEPIKQQSEAIEKFR